VVTVKAVTEAGKMATRYEDVQCLKPLARIASEIALKQQRKRDNRGPQNDASYPNTRLKRIS
jgi:hypothetical protein